MIYALHYWIAYFLLVDLLEIYLNQKSQANFHNTSSLPIFIVHAPKRFTG